MAAMTVTDLMLNFAEACQALGPAMDRAGVPWRDQSYDNWDRVADALFLTLVAEPCAFDAVGEAGLSRLRIAEYGFAAVDPQCNAWIALDDASARRVVELSTVTKPFDHVVVAGDGGLEQVAVMDARFVFVFETPAGTQERLSSVNLEAE